MPFLSDHVLAKRQVNTVAREDLWVSTFQIFVLIFFRKFRKSEIVQQVPKMGHVDDTSTFLVVVVKGFLEIAKHVAWQLVISLLLCLGALV